MKASPAAKLYKKESLAPKGELGIKKESLASKGELGIKRRAWQGGHEGLRLPTYGWRA